MCFTGVVSADNDIMFDLKPLGIESVMLMKSIRLIEGYNNEFRPSDNLTRAEASKVIFELLKIISL